jgi:FtsP/CotA-like multicopper oxidase with cupredoxin domain
MKPMTRRDWLSASKTALASSALLAGCAPGKHEVEASEPGSQALQLECKWMEKTVNGTRTRLRAFNGAVPGPMIKTRPGDHLRIRVKNSLTPYDSSGWNGDHNVPHHLDTTNLHLHGFDIAPHLFEPLGTSDPLAKMVHIMPGASYNYDFELPKDHPPGLYWYHPHHHGSTAVQAVSGMAGGAIVYGEIDEVPEIKAARDLPLVIQDLGLFPSETEADVWTYDPKQNAIWQTFGGNVTVLGKPTTLKGGFTTGDYALRYFLLNGEPFYQEKHNSGDNCATFPHGKQLKAQRIQMAPGEVVRFRMLNACSDNLMPIAVEGHEIHQIAMDGVNFLAPRTIPPVPVGSGNDACSTCTGSKQPEPDCTGIGQVLLAPGNRTEFLVKAVSKPGVYRIVQLAQSQQFLRSAQKVIAEIEVGGATKDMVLPKALPTPSRYYPLLNPNNVSATRTFVFGGAFPGVANPVVGIDFLINNSEYQEQAVPQVVSLNAVEDWQLQVFGAHHGGTEGHPFHIHVNHFEVISIDGKALPAGTIQDTAWIPMKSTVVVRMKFKQFKGKAVYHCHILPHEDTGMMQNFLIL